ncbi:hypothetical protein ABPG74_001972 [Tetrahymena malaccensis]
MDIYGQQSSMKQGKQTNLIKLQRDVLENVLKVSKREEESDGCVWKVLIFDSHCSNILSTLLKVGHLREMNITLHLNINQKGEKRDRLHGVKAYYLVQPTQDNVKAIMEDFNKDLYDQVYINFSSPADEELLQNLAAHVGKLNAVYKIKRVVQYTIDFVTLSRDFFSLNIKESYKSLRAAGTRPAAQVISQAAMGLFSLFRTMKKTPYIIYSDDKNNVLLAQELHSLFENLYKNSKEYEDESTDFLQPQFTQPVLILVDRDVDLGSMLLHPWHYGALIHDVYHIENSKVRISKPDSKDVQNYDLDSSNEDSYWLDKMNIPFPEVAKDIVERLQKWDIEYKQITSNKDDTSQMVAAMNNINEMKDQRRLIEMHMAISSGLKNELSTRHLDKYFEAGSTIIREKQLKGQEKSELIEMFQQCQAGAGKPNFDLDKLRVLIIYLLFVQDIDINEFKQLEEAAGITNKKFIQILEQFKQKRIPETTTSTAASSDTNLNSEEIADKLTSIFGKFASRVKSQGKGLINNVKNNLIGIEQDFEIATQVKSIIESKCMNSEKLGYKFIDILNNSNTLTQPKVFSDVVVFSLGGGNYNEYQNIQEIGKKLNKNIIYGGSEILNAETFIQQLTS